MVNVYFYDGNHEQACQHRGIVDFAHTFTDPFVLLVDDWNFPSARDATGDALSLLGYSVARQWEGNTPHDQCLDTWWNGFFAEVVTKS